MSTIPGSNEIIRRAWKNGLALPAFNIPYLAMVRPVIQGVKDEDSFALLEVAQVEWLDFGSSSPAAVKAEFDRWQHPDHVRLHLDHVPVSAGTHAFLDVIQEALDLGFSSVMVDASRLEYDENIAASRAAADRAHAAGIPCEAELGAVWRSGDALPPYDEMFRTGLGFTRVEQVERYVRESCCDWLSVAFGSIHGAVAEGLRDQKKVEARLNLELLDRLQQAAGIPLVLHGGSGVRLADVLAAVKHGIAKINVGTEIRQTYEAALQKTGSVEAAQDALYARVRWLIREYYGWTGTRRTLLEASNESARD